MAEITFHANDVDIAADGDSTLISHTAGSGLGFFGGGFGISVPVDQYQDNTWTTNSDGSSSGIQVGNTQYVSLSGVKYNGDAVAHETSGIPNRYAPLNIRFSHEDAVRVQNCKLRIFDRKFITNQASGVTTQVLEIRHPHPTPSYTKNANGPLAWRADGEDYGWNMFDATELTIGDEDVVSLTTCPGHSGLNTSSDEPLPKSYGDYINWTSNSGALWSSTRHDWYVALSASPQEIGSKTDYGLYFTVEYL